MQPSRERVQELAVHQALRLHHLRVTIAHGGQLTRVAEEDEVAPDLLERRHLREDLKRGLERFVDEPVEVLLVLHPAKEVLHSARARSP